MKLFLNLVMAEVWTNICFMRCPKVPCLSLIVRIQRASFQSEPQRPRLRSQTRKLTCSPA